MNIRCFKK